MLNGGRASESSNIACALPERRIGRRWHENDHERGINYLRMSYWTEVQFDCGFDLRPRKRGLVVEVFFFEVTAGAIS